MRAGMDLGLYLLTSGRAARGLLQLRSLGDDGSGDHRDLFLPSGCDGSVQCQQRSDVRAWVRAAVSLVVITARHQAGH